MLHDNKKPLMMRIISYIFKKSMIVSNFMHLNFYLKLYRANYQVTMKLEFTQLTFTCSISTDARKRCKICSKLTIKTAE